MVVRKRKLPDVFDFFGKPMDRNGNLIGQSEERVTLTKEDKVSQKKPKKSEDRIDINLLFERMSEKQFNKALAKVDKEIFDCIFKRVDYGSQTYNNAVETIELLLRGKLEYNEHLENVGLTEERFNEYYDLFKFFQSFDTLKVSGKLLPRPDFLFKRDRNNSFARLCSIFGSKYINMPRLSRAQKYLRWLSYCKEYWKRNDRIPENRDLNTIAEDLIFFISRITLYKDIVKNEIAKQRTKAKV